MLVFSLLAPRLGRRVSLQIDGERSARLGLLGLLLYLALCGGLREKSFSMLRETAGAASSASAFSYVFPEPFGPWRFRGVLRMADEYKVYLIRPLSGELEYRKSYLTEEREPSVIRLRDSSSGRKYEWFFKAPLWKRVSDEEALVSDIRFKSLLFEREGAFTYTVSSHSSDSR